MLCYAVLFISHFRIYILFVMGKLLLACLTFCLVATVASQPNIFEG